MSDEELMKLVAEASRNARDREMENLRRKKLEAEQARLLEIKKASEGLMEQVLNRWEPGNPGVFRVVVSRSCVHDVIAILRGKGFTEENFWLLRTEITSQDYSGWTKTTIILEVILPIGLPENQEVKRWPTDEEAGKKYEDKGDFRKAVADLVDRIHSEVSFERIFTARKVQAVHLKALKCRLREAGLAKRPWSITTSLYDERQSDYWYDVTVSRSS